VTEIDHPDPVRVQRRPMAGFGDHEMLAVSRAVHQVTEELRTGGG